MFKNEINFNIIKLENEISNSNNLIENKLDFIKIKLIINYLINIILKKEN